MPRRVREPLTEWNMIKPKTGSLCFYPDVMTTLAVIDLFKFYGSKTRDALFRRIVADAVAFRGGSLYFHTKEDRDRVIDGDGTPRRGRPPVTGEYTKPTFKETT